MSSNIGQQGSHRLSVLRMSRTAILVTMPMRAFRADEDTAEIVSRVSGTSPPSQTISPSSSDDFDAEYMIGGDPVGERMRPAGIIRDIAADGAGGLAARVRRIKKPSLATALVTSSIDHAGFDDGDTVLQIDFQDSIQSRKREDDAALGGNGAAGKAGSRATGNMGTFARLAALMTADTCSMSAGMTTISGMT